jgi:hypothetical protein
VEATIQPVMLLSLPFFLQAVGLLTLEGGHGRSEFIV